MLNEIVTKLSKMTPSHCAGTVQMREEDFRKGDKKVRRGVIYFLVRKHRIRLSGDREQRAQCTNPDRWVPCA